MFEPNIWICKNCGQKNYYPISSDIMIYGDKLHIWDPKAKAYRTEDIKCSKCGTKKEPEWLVQSSPKKVTCSICGASFEMP